MGRHTDRVNRILNRYGVEAFDVYQAWRSASRPLACARYVNGMLAWCPEQGEGYWELECDARIAAEASAYVHPLPRAQLDVGCYGIDLRAEEQRSGVPASFMPNASRRKRAHAYTHTGPQRWVYYRGHHLRITHAGIAKHYKLELMVYLREGDDPFAPHHSESVHHLLTGQG